ncbi:MAG TPA: 23S rRNA (pseudouridine(1915)-N(3))-methyltransferase RlmH [Mariprofundaceae bacterium]|nr:23S rRNA (pseudouridine(1915)-N(3))-methyltransferase RlmH [Mariprofundaceae bacterium]
MKIRLWVVGRGNPALAAYEAEFRKRLGAFADVQVGELPEGRSKQLSQRRQEEGRQILQKAAKGFVLFDERGKLLASHDWAGRLQQLPGDGCLDLVIGGAGGISDEVRAAAGDCWSLSKLTLPHQLVRVMVLEQLYRAFTILKGHPYHRE